jgi:molybdopterin molybdotransferase
MISYRDAIRQISLVAEERVSSDEVCALENSLGRVLSQDIVGYEAVPSFDNSAMDGFALTAQATLAASRENPVRFGVKRIIAAGDEPTRVCGSEFAAVEIMTGAPLPGGAFDAVVKIEDVEVRRDGDGTAVEISVREPVAVGQNVRRRGEDFAPGQAVARRGTRVRASQIMACAALGVSQVRVFRRPKVAVISTGRELVHHSEPVLKPGMIRNSTAPFLMASLSALGAEAKFHGSNPDNAEEFRQLMDHVLADEPDVVITTGAVSMGKYDFVHHSLEKLGAEILFHKAAIRPGKPILFAKMKSSNTVFFGVPGNPISTAVGLKFFISPYLRARFGLAPEKPQPARLSSDVPKPDGLRCFFKGKLEINEGVAEVRALKGQASFMISPFLESNCWVVFSEEGNVRHRGQDVEVFTLAENWDEELVL